MLCEELMIGESKQGCMLSCFHLRVRLRAVAGDIQCSSCLSVGESFRETWPSDGKRKSVQ